MHRKLVALSLLGLVALLAACMGQPIGLSAQRGSTIAIPIQGLGPVPTDTTPLAYGGTDWVDAQRGELVFQLDAAGGFELTTRLAFEAEGTRRGHVIGATTTRQVVVLVDIPVDAPLGSHTLHLLRRLDGVDTPVTPAYQGSIKILEQSYDVPLAGGGLETISGAPTPLQYYGPALNGGVGWHAITPDIGVPQPSFVVKLNKNLGTSPDARKASSLVAQISYDDERINLLRVVPVAHQADHFWMEGPQGNITVRGVGLTASALGGFTVVFQNLAGEPVSPSEFQLSLVDATDQVGSSAIVNDWSLALVQGAIE